MDSHVGTLLWNYLYLQEKEGGEGRGQKQGKTLTRGVLFLFFQGMNNFLTHCLQER